MRKLVMAVALLMMMPGTAVAWCVDCRTLECYYTRAEDGALVVTAAPQCGNVPIESGLGYENCRNVGQCSGCMGWTCRVQDTAAPPQYVALGPTSVTVIPAEAAPAQNAEGPIR